MSPLLVTPLPCHPQRGRSTVARTISNPQLSPLVTCSSALEDSDHSKRSLGTIPALIPPKNASTSTSPKRSPCPSPSKEKWSFMANLTGDKRGQVKVENKGVTMADWFKGESEPVNITVLPSPTKETGDPLASTFSSSIGQSSTKLQRKSTLTPATRPAAASRSRFSLFGGKAAQAPSSHSHVDLNDEFVTLDIKTALLPSGQADPFSPSAFKNLFQNAEGLLTRVQIEYKQRVHMMQEMTVEKEVQGEELEEAKTRARHLKVQLDDMATTQVEQDKVIEILVKELAQEKQLRKEEDDARKRSVRLVVTDRAGYQDGKPRRRQRSSIATTVSDSGFESNDEGATDSEDIKLDNVDSPTLSVSSASSVASPDNFRSVEFPLSKVDSQTSKRCLDVPPYRLAASQPINAAVTCANCEGVKASEAWNVVNVLKEENKALKLRVGDLEGVVDGCLDMVHGWAG